MKTMIIVLAALLICGCTEPLTNEQIGAIRDQCAEMGMGVRWQHDGWQGLHIHDGQCDPHSLLTEDSQ